MVFFILLSAKQISEPQLSWWDLDDQNFCFSWLPKMVCVYFENVQTTTLFMLIVWHSHVMQVPFHEICQWKQVDFSLKMLKVWAFFFFKSFNFFILVREEWKVKNPLLYLGTWLKHRDKRQSSAALFLLCLYPTGQIKAKCVREETGVGNRGRHICRFPKLSQKTDKDLLELIKKDTQF